MSCLVLGPFTHIKGLQFYRDNDDDPYVTLKEVRATPHSTIHLQTGRMTKNSSARKMKHC